MRILVVEDEPRMAQMLQRGLSEEGHVVDVCERGQDALRQACDIAYDAIVLDWSLPDRDGVSVLRAFRDAGFHTPVLMLTARGSTGEKVTGLRAGADDYLVKPFDFEELLARLEALGRRGGSLPPTLEVGPVQLDTRRRTMRGPEGEAELTAREYALASALWSRPGEVLTRSRLLEAAWGVQFERTYNVVDVYVGYLRSKLRAVAGDGVEIQAVRGMGYRLVARNSPA